METAARGAVLGARLIDYSWNRNASENGGMLTSPISAAHHPPNMATRSLPHPRTPHNRAPLHTGSARLQLPLINQLLIFTLHTILFLMSSFPWQKYRRNTCGIWFMKLVWRHECHISLNVRRTRLSTSIPSVSCCITCFIRTF